VDRPAPPPGPPCRTPCRGVSPDSQRRGVQVGGRPAGRPAARHPRRPRLNFPSPAGTQQVPGREPPGEVSEWLKEQHWKCCIGVTLSGVRIPPSPLQRLPDREPLCFWIRVYRLRAQFTTGTRALAASSDLYPALRL